MSGISRDDVELRSTGAYFGPRTELVDRKEGIMSRVEVQESLDRITRRIDDGMQSFFEWDWGEVCAEIGGDRADGAFDCFQESWRIPRESGEDCSPYDPVGAWRECWGDAWEETAEAYGQKPYRGEWDSVWRASYLAASRVVDSVAHRVVSQEVGGELNELDQVESERLERVGGERAPVDWFESADWEEVGMRLWTEFREQAFAETYREIDVAEELDDDLRAAVLNAVDNAIRYVEDERDTYASVCRMVERVLSRCLGERS